MTVNSLRWVRANQSEYEEVLKRFRRDVDVSKIKSRDEFQTKVTEWANFSKLTKHERSLPKEEQDRILSRRKHHGKKLAQAFMEIIAPPKKKRKMRRVAVDEIIPKKQDRQIDWQRHEVAILRFEQRKGKGYAKRVAMRLEFERSLASIYKKASRLRMKEQG